MIKPTSVVCVSILGIYLLVFFFADFAPWREIPGRPIESRKGAKLAKVSVPNESERIHPRSLNDKTDQRRVRVHPRNISSCLFFAGFAPWREIPGRPIESRKGAKVSVPNESERTRPRSLNDKIDQRRVVCVSILGIYLLVLSCLFFAGFAPWREIPGRPIESRKGAKLAKVSVPNESERIRPRSLNDKTDQRRVRVHHRNISSCLLRRAR